MNHRYSLSVDGRERSYLVYAPNRQDALPVVVMLHGAGGTAEWTLRETRWEEYAEREGFLLLLPEATRPDPKEPASFLLNPQVWNDGAVEGIPARPDVDDVAFVLTMLDDVASRYAIEPSRRYVTGFSNGAAMAFRLAAEGSKRFAAVAPVAGYCQVRKPATARPIPTLYLVGRVDPLVPFAGGEIVTPWSRKRVIRPSVAETLTQWAQVFGWDVHRRTNLDEAGVTIEEYPGDVPFLVYTIDELGHHWPGGRGELNRRIAGPPSNLVDACAVIWEFFRSHGSRGI